MLYKNAFCGACALFLLTTNAQAASMNMQSMPAPAGTPPNTVIIKSFMFTPMSLTIPAGTTVTWHNMDGEPHTAVSIDGLFRSPALDENDTYSFKFDKPGTYKFLCSIHPQMRGTIVVTAR
ncbi:MAG TPA: cupredoxin family copper-binding protein [Rhizomicrobium sp.]|nr:cupredoxin family copper-binding protein [Rhizomicrobium sp.]